MFFKTYLWINACFKFLLWIKYYFSSCKLASSFSTFSIFILSGINSKLLWSSYNFRIWNINFKKISFITVFIIVFHEIFIKLRCIFDALNTILQVIFVKIVHPYRLLTSQYFKYDDSLFLSKSFIYLLLAFTYWWIAWHIPPLIALSTINNLSIPNVYATSNWRRFHVYITSINWRPNFDKFPRHFHALFQCDFADRKLYVVSTSFFQRNFDGRKIHVISTYFSWCKFRWLKNPPYFHVPFLT